jgi:hypothetical protein
MVTAEQAINSPACNIRVMTILGCSCVDRSEAFYRVAKRDARHVCVGNIRQTRVSLIKRAGVVYKLTAWLERVIVGTETIAEIVSNYELPIACEKCGAQSQKTIGWIRLHRDMKCPGCDAVIVLNTSRITGTIRSVERRLGDLQSQLTERIRKL